MWLASLLFLSTHSYSFLTAVWQAGTQGRVHCHQRHGRGHEGAGWSYCRAPRRGQGCKGERFVTSPYSTLYFAALYHRLFQLTILYSHATCVQRAKKDARADEQTDDDRKEAKKAKKAKKAAAAAATATAAVAASSAATARAPSVNQLLTASGKDEKLLWALRCVPCRS